VAFADHFCACSHSHVFHFAFQRIFDCLLHLVLLHHCREKVFDNRLNFILILPILRLHLPSQQRLQLNSHFDLVHAPVDHLLGNRYVLFEVFVDEGSLIITHAHLSNDAVDFLKLLDILFRLFDVDYVQDHLDQIHFSQRQKLWVSMRL
jgi:hypothetical protein